MTVQTIHFGDLVNEAFLEGIMIGLVSHGSPPSMKDGDWEVKPRVLPRRCSKRERRSRWR